MIVYEEILKQFIRTNQATLPMRVFLQKVESLEKRIVSIEEKNKALIEALKDKE